MQQNNNTELTPTSSNLVVDVLQAIDRGGFVHTLEEELRSAVMASCEHLKKAEVTIKLTIDPDTKSDAIRVSGAIKTKLPEPPTKASLFFPTPEGGLSRVDPRQREMFNNDHYLNQQN